MIRRPQISTLFPYPTLSRPDDIRHDAAALVDRAAALGFDALAITLHDRQLADARLADRARDRGIVLLPGIERTIAGRHVDRKSTRLNSSHSQISYAVFCLNN